MFLKAISCKATLGSKGGQFYPCVIPSLAESHTCSYLLLQALIARMRSEVQFQGFLQKTGGNMKGRHASVTAYDKDVRCVL